MKTSKTSPAFVAVNARRHYASRPPVWNPSTAIFYVLRRVAGILRFCAATAMDWAILATQGKRKAAPGTVTPKQVKVWSEYQAARGAYAVMRDYCKGD